MATVIALRGFDHGGIRRRGDQFFVSDQFARDMERRGLVRVVRPMEAIGKKSSASPVAQASPKQTLKRSGSGVKKAKIEKS